MSHRPGSPDRHGWQRLDNYLAVHDAHLRALEQYFVEHSTLRFTVVGPQRILLHGSVYCRGELVLHVDTILARNDRNQVKGLRYRYQAQFADAPFRQVFRYDNDHVYRREGHADAFHKHQFSDRTWREVKPPVWIGYEDWPVLSEVLDELYEWWLDHRDDRLVYP